MCAFVHRHDDRMAFDLTCRRFRWPSMLIELIYLRPGQTQSWWASDQQNRDFSRTLRQIGLKFGGCVPCAELPHCAAALGAGKWYALAE